MELSFNTTFISDAGPRGLIWSPSNAKRVLRNTYWLLALNLLPTVLGAWIGVSTGITAGLNGGVGFYCVYGGGLWLYVRH